MTKRKYTVLLSPVTFAIVFSVLVVSLGALLSVGTASGGNFLTTLTVVGSGRTQTIITSSAKSSEYGQPVTFTATVRPIGVIRVPTGRVRFSDGSKKLGSGLLIKGNATLRVTNIRVNASLSVGKHEV